MSLLPEAAIFGTKAPNLPYLRSLGQCDFLIDRRGVVFSEWDTDKWGRCYLPELSLIVFGDNIINGEEHEGPLLHLDHLLIEPLPRVEL